MSTANLGYCDRRMLRKWRNGRILEIWASAVPDFLANESQGLYPTFLSIQYCGECSNTKRCCTLWWSTIVPSLISQCILATYNLILVHPTFLFPASPLHHRWANSRTCEPSNLASTPQWLLPSSSHSYTRNLQSSKAFRVHGMAALLPSIQNYYRPVRCSFPRFWRREKLWRAQPWLCSFLWTKPRHVFLESWMSRPPNDCRLNTWFVSMALY